jgi:hypothetical protein
VNHVDEPHDPAFLGVLESHLATYKALPEPVQRGPSRPGGVRSDGPRLVSSSCRAAWAAAWSGPRHHRRR